MISSKLKRRRQVVFSSSLSQNTSWPTAKYPLQMTKQSCNLGLWDSQRREQSRSASLAAFFADLALQYHCKNQNHHQQYFPSSYTDDFSQRNKLISVSSLSEKLHFWSEKYIHENSALNCVELRSSGLNWFYLHSFVYFALTCTYLHSIALNCPQLHSLALKKCT